MTSLTGDPTTDAVLPAALRLVWAVREDDASEEAAALDEAYASVQQAGLDPSMTLHALILTLAGMVPDDRSAAELLTWLRNPSGYIKLRQQGLGADIAASIAAEHARDAA